MEIVRFLSSLKEMQILRVSMLTFSCPVGFRYCGDYRKHGIIYLSGRKSPHLADMDVDCDGANNAAGKCSNDPSGQSETAFKDTVQSYGIPDLDASIHSYIVFGNEGDLPFFYPGLHDMKPLSVMAVICNNQLVCAYMRVLFPVLASLPFRVPRICLLYSNQKKRSKQNKLCLTRQRINFNLM